MTNQINLKCPYCGSQKQFKLSGINWGNYNEKVIEGVKMLDTYDNKMNNEWEYKVYSSDRHLLVVKLHNNQIAGYFPSAEKFIPRINWGFIPEKIRESFEIAVGCQNRNFEIGDDDPRGNLDSIERGIETPQPLIDIINCIAPNEEKPTKDSLENIQLPKNNVIRCALIFIGFANEPCLCHATKLSCAMALHFLDCHLAHTYGKRYSRT